MPQQPSSERYLCIDLDGTLVRTDTFAEALLGFLCHFPLRLPQLLIWLLKGRAFLKMKVCEATRLDRKSTRLTPVTPISTLFPYTTLFRSLLGFLCHFPLRLPQLLIWLLKGRAFLKMKVCEATR